MGFSHHEKDTYRTRVWRAGFGSTNDRVVIISQQGDITFVNTNVLSRFGSDLYAKNVTLLDLVTKDRVIESNSSFWGLSRDDYKEVTERSWPTIIANYDPGITRIHAFDGYVYTRGTIFSMPGTLDVFATHDIIHTTSVLNTESWEHSRGVEVSAFGVNIIGSSDKPTLPASSSYSTYLDMDQLFRSKGFDEVILNSMSTSVELVNTINAISEGVNQNQLLGLRPEFNFTYREKTSHSRSQARGSGGIFADELHERAGHNVTFEGLPVYVSGNMTVDAEEFIQRGMALDSYLDSSDRSFTMTLHPEQMNRPDFGIASQEGRSSARHYATQSLYVGGQATMNIHRWRMEDAYTNLGSLQGNLNTLSLISHPDTFESNTKIFDINTNGNIAFQQGSNYRQTLAQPTELHARQDLEGNFAIELTGAKITSDRNINLTGPISSRDVSLMTRENSRGFSFNVKDSLSFFKSNNAHYDNMLNPSASHHPIHTININQDSDVSDEVQHSVIYGNQGTRFGGLVNGSLSTSASSGRETIREESHHWHAQIPILDQQGRQSFSRAWEKITGTASSSVERQKLVSHLGALLNHEPHEAMVRQEVQRLYLVSDLVYRTDDGEAIAKQNGLYLESTYDDPQTGTHIAIYVDEEHQESYIAFRGTNSMAALSKNDMDVFLGRPIRGIENPEAQRFISNEIKYLQQQGYSIALTGHSLGAAQASLVSSQYDLPAVVFDNPGLPSSYNLDQVLSFQSLPNLVNDFPKMTDYSYGTVWQLVPTRTDIIRNAVLGELGAQRFFSVPAGMFQSYENHQLKKINERLDNIWS